MFRNNSQSALYLGPTSGVADEAAGGRTAKTVTSIGSVAVVTGQGCPGGRALEFNGATQCLTFPSAPDMSFGAGDFFIGFWAYFTADPSSAATLAKGVVGATRSWVVANGCQLFISSSGSAWISTGFSGLYSALNTWNHYAYSRKGTKWTQFKDGGVAHQYTGSHTLYTNTDALGVASYGDGSARSGVRLSGVHIIPGWGIDRAFTPPNRLL